MCPLTAILSGPRRAERLGTRLQTDSGLSAQASRLWRWRQSLIRLGLVTRQTLIGVIATPRWRCSTDGNRDPTKITMPAHDVAAADNRMTHHWRQSRPRPYHVRWSTWSNRVGRETRSL